MVLDCGVSEEGFYENEHSNDEDQIKSILDYLIFNKMLVDFPKFVEQVSGGRNDEDDKTDCEEGDEISVVEDECENDFHLTYIIINCIKKDKAAV